MELFCVVRFRRQYDDDYYTLFITYLSLSVSPRYVSNPNSIRVRVYKKKKKNIYTNYKHEINRPVIHYIMYITLFHSADSHIINIFLSKRAQDAKATMTANSAHTKYTARTQVCFLFVPLHAAAAAADRGTTRNNTGKNRFTSFVSLAAAVFSLFFLRAHMRCVRSHYLLVHTQSLAVSPRPHCSRGANTSRARGPKRRCAAKRHTRARARSPRRRRDALYGSCAIIIIPRRHSITSCICSTAVVRTATTAFLL